MHTIYFMLEGAKEHVANGQHDAALAMLVEMNLFYQEADLDGCGLMAQGLIGEG